MLKPFVPSDADEPVPPQCRATVEQLQRVLDGNATADSLDADPHSAACPTCRERVRAARVLLCVLAVPSEPVAVPVGLVDIILSAVKADRYARTRRRVYVTAGGLALAAALLVAVFAIVYRPQPVVSDPLPVVPGETVQGSEVAPAPREKRDSAPEPRPLRIGDALANAGQSLETPKPIADSAAVAPKLLGALTDPFTKPMGNPVAADLEPARKSIAELPNATRSGLEPVTGTAQKALDRFLRDMGSVQPIPNS